MGPIAAALARSQSRLSSLSVTASRYGYLSCSPLGNPIVGSYSSHPAPVSARHFHDWRSSLSHRASVRSSATVAERFERHFATEAAKNSYEDILMPLAKPGGGEFGKFYSLPALEDPRIDRLPYSIKILLESAIRNCDEFHVSGKDVEKIIDWENSAPKQVEIPFKPARVLLQDFTGVPAVVDLACMRDAMNKLGSDSNKINPLDLTTKRTIGKRKQEWGLYVLENYAEQPVACSAISRLHLIYSKLDHPSLRSLQQLDTSFRSTSSIECKSCHLGKFHRAIYPPRL